MTELKIPLPQEKLADFCRRNHIRKLSVFGSILDDRFSSKSDIDILVDFEPGHVPGLAFIRLQEELSTILGGRKVDLVTPKFLNRRIRPAIEAEAVIQYAQK
jgi:uncharacterized protein